MLDVTAIYSVFSALAAYALLSLAGAGAWLMTGLMFVVAGLAAYLLSNRIKRNMHLIIGIFLGTAYVVLLVHMALRGNWTAWPYLLSSLGTFAVAFLI